MNDDVESFRELYSEAIHWSDDDFKNALADSLDSTDGDKNSIKSFHDYLKNDIKNIRNGSAAVLTWAGIAPTIPKKVKTYTLVICLGKALKLNRYSGIAIERIISSLNWKKPFDPINKKLSETNFSVSQELLQIMHEKIAWGHNWYSVGEWGAAIRHYINALVIAIATNNIDAIEAITHFLVDSYVASENYESATKITIAFIKSQGYRKTNLNYMTRRMLEAIAIGLAMENKISDCQRWLNRIPELCETRSEQSVNDWKISQWLTDVYFYKNNKTGITKLNLAINTVTRLLKNWEGLQKSISQSI